jgi:hypothetical protein
LHDGVFGTSPVRNVRALAFAGAIISHASTVPGENVTKIRRGKQNTAQSTSPLQRRCSCRKTA